MINKLTFDQYTWRGSNSNITGSVRHMVVDDNILISLTVICKLSDKIISVIFQVFMNKFVLLINLIKNGA